MVSLILVGCGKNTDYTESVSYEDKEVNADKSNQIDSSTYTETMEETIIEEGQDSSLQ